ncbi:LPXTG cell wall anchor domain-containing protein [Brevundimonas sp.]|uniref:LPXTG cell wall anchor domain-containing protein n=1 Tax=Brevundimonas sp. TaxID=1871086 RepID=UPI002D6EF5CF|nr:LPXTG cell wall anchor domain-containing protein [Brevundimonas sp.]HYD29137.1 LPXTG cell wall anchor domain-containing protein [Brevundimonas sp.]
MDRPQKPINWQVMVWAGLADMIIGVSLATAALTGFLGDSDQMVLAFVGGLLVLVGLGLFLWARNNLSKAESRRGDLN